jgi:hypothetical protein
MTERERWIVYPLLFLALGAALRDKLFDQTTSKSIICEDIVCQELTVVDAEPRGNRQANILARIGRNEPHAGVPTSGHLFVNGQLEVHGVVNAQHYAYQGVPFVPALRSLPLGILSPDLLRAIPQASPRSQQANAPTQPSSSQPPQAQRSEQPPTAEPLADPAEKR